MGKKQHGTALRKTRCGMSVEMQLKFVLSFIFGVVQFEIPGIALSDSSDTWMLYIGKKTQLMHLQNREKLWVL